MAYPQIVPDDKREGEAPIATPQPMFDAWDIVLLAGLILLGFGLASIDAWLLVAGVGAALVYVSVRR